jgi:hypothetical protein
MTNLIASGSNYLLQWELMEFTTHLFAIMQILIENHWKVRKCKFLIPLATFHYPDEIWTTNLPVRNVLIIFMTTRPFLKHFLTLNMEKDFFWHCHFQARFLDQGSVLHTTSSSQKPPTMESESWWPLLHWSKAMK